MKNSMRSKTLNKSNDQSISNKFWRLCTETLKFHNYYEARHEKDPEDIYNLLKTHLETSKALNTEEYVFDEDLLFKWSPNNEWLILALTKLGYQAEIANKPFLRWYFQTLNLQNSKIVTLDDEFQCFDRLTRVDISYNPIQTLQNLPSQLRELNAYGCCIKNIYTPPYPHQSLIHLGIAYNELGDRGIANLVGSYPQLFSIDIGYNHIQNLEKTTNILGQFANLKVLNVVGNPFTLLPYFQSRMLQLLPNLANFDDTSLLGDKSPRKNKGSKEPKKAQTDTFSLTLKVAEEEKEVLNQVGVRIEISICENLKGVEITEDMLPEGVELDTLDPTHRQSIFWISFVFLNKEYKSGLKYWGQDFMQDEGIGKCDIAFAFKEYLPPNILLRDNLNRGLYLKLWEQRPKLQIEEETNVEKAILTEGGAPEVEQFMRGVAYIPTRIFLNKDVNRLEDDPPKAHPGSPESQIPHILHNKFWFFDPKLQTRTEFLFQDPSLWKSFTRKERAAIVEEGKLRLDEKVQKDAEALIVNTGKVEEVKGAKGKPPVKKDAGKGKKKAPVGVGKDSVPVADVGESLAPEMLKFMVLEKGYKQGMEAFLQQKEIDKIEAKKKKKSAPTPTPIPTNVNTETGGKGTARILNYFDILVPMALCVSVKIRVNEIEDPKEEEKEEVVPAKVDAKKAPPPAKKAPPPKKK